MLAPYIHQVKTKHRRICMAHNNVAVCQPSLAGTPNTYFRGHRPYFRPSQPPAMALATGASLTDICRQWHRSQALRCDSQEGGDPEAGIPVQKEGGAGGGGGGGRALGRIRGASHSHGTSAGPLLQRPGRSTRAAGATVRGVLGWGGDGWATGKRCARWGDGLVDRRRVHRSVHQ